MKNLLYIGYFTYNYIYLLNIIFIKNNKIIKELKTVNMNIDYIGVNNYYDNKSNIKIKTSIQILKDLIYEK